MLLILGILAAVVVVNVVGLTGRGEVESYAVDERTIQMSVSTFYSDAHAYSSTGGWNEPDSYTSVHNYPTAAGTASNLYLGNETDMGEYKVHVVMDDTDGMPATMDDIETAAIWMALLVKVPGEGDWFGAGPDAAPGDANSPLAGEPGPYLNRLPKSCSNNNSSASTGTFTWIVGAYNRIYGVFEQGGVWYAGFGGQYP